MLLAVLKGEFVTYAASRTRVHEWPIVVEILPFLVLCFLCWVVGNA